jgi:hypothetical protein
MDPVDAAIEAAQPQPVRLRQVQVTIASSGRPFVLAIPEDLSEAELFEIVGWMSNDLRIGLAQQRSPASRIVVPGGVRLT